VVLIKNFHLVPRLRKEYSNTCISPLSLHGLFWVTSHFQITFFFNIKLIRKYINRTVFVKFEANIFFQLSSAVLNVLSKK